MSAALTPEEREAAVSRLSAAFADDVLEVEEFERRVTKVYDATTTHALVALTHDLPVAESRAVSRADSHAIDTDRAPVQRIRSVLSRDVWSSAISPFVSADGATAMARPRSYESRGGCC